MTFEETSPEVLARRLERFVDNLPGLAYRCEPTEPWEMAFIRGRVEEVTGYPSAAFEEDRVTYGDLVHPDDADELVAVVRSGVAAREQFTASYRIETRDGGVTHVFERGVPVVEDDEVVALEGIIVDVTERKRSQQELERQNDLFERTQHLANVGGWEYDVAAESLRLTDQAKRIFGLPLGLSPSAEETLAYYHPEDRSLIQSSFQAAITEAEPFDHELRIETAHGERRWVRARGTPVVDDDTVVSVRGAIQDVTDRRGREEALREEQALTTSVFEALPDIIYAFDEDGTFSRWNDRLPAVSGYDDAELAEMDVLDLVAAADRNRVDEHMARVFENGESTTVEARLQTADGDHVPYEFTGAPLRTDGEIEGLVGVGRDRSDRKERERRFEAVFENTYQFTGLMEPDGTLVEANDTGLEFPGEEAGDPTGGKLWETPAFQTPAAREAARAGVEQAREGEFYRTEIPMRAESGEAVVDFSIRPITDDAGEVTLLVPEGRDVTALKERERLLRLLHRVLRHNLRNDLNTIRGYAEMLAAESPEEPVAEYAAQVKAAARELMGMSETSKEFITLALDHEETSRPVDVAALLRRLVADLRRTYPGASVELDGDDSAVVSGDARLEYLFAELLENAVEHGAAGADGRAEADGGRPDEPGRSTVSVTVEERDEEVCVTVADDGPGIPADEWATVVEEGAVESSQLRHGSGVGLLLAKWVVDRQGGSMQYATPEAGGSRVTVHLPKT